jgi:hypothetical protein
VIAFGLVDPPPHLVDGDGSGLVGQDAERAQFVRGRRVGQRRV